MNHYSARLLVLVLAVGVSACSHAASSHHQSMSFDGGAISYKHDSVVIKPKGEEEARVAGDGTLTIGGSEVALDAKGKAALAAYNAQGTQFLDQAMNLGLDSADFALHTIGQVFAGLFTGDPDRAGREAEQGGHAIELQAKALCQRIDQWREAQDAAAAAVPQFRPYAVITPKDTRDCFVDDHHDRHENRPADPAPAPAVSGTST